METIPGSTRGRETSPISASQKNFPCCSILDQEITRMIFNKARIISGQHVNRKEILLCARYM
jgi:hypothetical protein